MLLRLAIDGKLGTTGKSVADDIWTAFGGHAFDFAVGQASKGQTQTSPAPSAPSTSTRTASAPAQRYIDLSLHDLGGVPLAYDVSRGVVMQSPSWVSANAPSNTPNVYSHTDVFLDEAGNTVSYDQALQTAAARTA